MPRTLPSVFPRRACALALAPMLGAVLAVDGCADLRHASGPVADGVNVESPVAPAVLAATRARLVTPSFRDVPPAPRNTPSPAALKARVEAQVAERERLDSWIAAHPAGGGDQQGFLSASRAAASQGGQAPAADDTATAEAWAAQTRRAAAPPPPVPASGP